MLDKLPKNTWIEFAVDRARAEIGEDATDEDIAALIQTQIGPICRHRGDSPPDFARLFMQCDTSHLRRMSKKRANELWEQEHQA